MDLNKIVEEVIKTDAFKHALAEYLAQAVTDTYHYHDIEGTLIKPEIRAIIKSEAKSVVKNYLDDYYEANSLEREIKKQSEQLLKEKLSQLLVTTEN